MFPRAFRSYNVFVRPSSLRERRAEIEARPGRFERLEAPEGLHLFRVVGRGAPGAADPPHRAVPAGGPPIGAEGPEGLRLLRGRCAEEELRPGEGCWIVTTWEATADAGPLPVQIYVRARRGGGRVPEQFAFRRDPAVRPWAGHPLGEPSFPSLLWREGEIVNDSHFVRVPLGCPPGRYEVQVVAETRPFFPVRRMRGLERGAVRDDWRPIDTLEVLP
ncbi:MAG: hypothetical protein EHM19_05155 [Candidatus Latescibacterota bacterium]|nr:MAG: hypothetical protein EHM19_05155 [Candidatus Latescibacterota bacterium]